MRRITDHDGGEWDVAVGKESYGTLVILFSSRATNEVRKVILQAETALDAELELEAASDSELVNRLAESMDWG